MNYLSCSKKILEVLVDTAGNSNIYLFSKKKPRGEYIFKFSNSSEELLKDGFTEYDIYNEDGQRIIKALNFFSQNGEVSEIDLSNFSKINKAYLFLNLCVINTDFVIENYEKMFNEVIFTDLLKITKQNSNNERGYENKSDAHEQLLCYIVEVLPHDIFAQLVEKSIITSRSDLKDLFSYIKNPEFITSLSKSLKHQQRFLENNKELIAELLNASLKRFPNIKKEVASHHQFLHKYIIENEDFNFLNQEKSHLNIVKMEFDTRKIYQVLSMQNFTLEDTNIFFENITTLMMEKLKLKGLKDYDLDKKKSSNSDYLYVLFLQFNTESKINSKTVESLFINCIQEAKKFTIDDSTNTKKIIPLVDKVLMDMLFPEIFLCFK